LDRILFFPLKNALSFMGWFSVDHPPLWLVFEAALSPEALFPFSAERPMRAEMKVLSPGVWVGHSFHEPESSS